MDKITVYETLFEMLKNYVDCNGTNQINGGYVCGIVDMAEKFLSKVENETD